MDRRILEKAENEMAEERKKQSALKTKMLQQKEMRERMITESNDRKAVIESRAKKQEKDAVRKLQLDFAKD